jgi:hypothetical protein
MGFWPLAGIGLFIAAMGLLSAPIIAAWVTMRRKPHDPVDGDEAG